jgi:hypothetical protein
MFTLEEHLDDLIRHIDLVQAAGILLGKRLITAGRPDFGRLIIAKVYGGHDESKFYGIEWQLLHKGPGFAYSEIQPAVKQHHETNAHHPEYWGGFENMPEIAVAEMVCDWYARSQELGTGLREWIRDEAIPRYGIDMEGEQYRWVQRFVDLLLQTRFTRK